MAATMARSVIILIFLLLCTNSERQIFIEYGVGQQGWQLYKFFYDIDDGFYVDIGAYDPIFASNTLNLYTRGWGGINIDANPSRLNRFFLMRPDQTNLNYAIGQQNQYLTLYELDQDSSSTVSKKVMQYVKSYKPVVAEIKIPSLSLKQICDRYYYRNTKPLFINLDIQGYGSKALQGNQWNKDKCIPDLILSQFNEESVQSGLALPEQILKKYGYKKFNKRIGLNQLFIHMTVYQKYIQKYQAMDKKIDNYQMTSIQQITNSLIRKLKISSNSIPHYQPISDSIYYKFTKKNQIIDLNKLNQQSNKLTDSKKLNRYIVIYHFHLKSNIIVIKQGQWEFQEFNNVTQFKFYQVTVKKIDGGIFKVYILDHYYANTKGLKPRIVDGNKQAYFLEELKCYVPPLANVSSVGSSQNITEQQQKQLQVIRKSTSIVTKQLKTQTQLLSRLNQDHKTQSQQLKITFLTNHNTQINILQKISQKVSNYARIFQKQKQKKPIIQTKKLNRVNTQLYNLRTIQNIILGVIGIMVLSLCITCVCVRRKNRGEENYGMVEDASVSDTRINV